MEVFCRLCGKKHLTETSRLLARIPGITETKVEWTLLPSLYTDKELCHPCYIKLKKKGVCV